MKRLPFAILAALLALVPFVPTSNAGGWAAVVFNAPITEVEIGEETIIEFQVLAHGRPETPVQGMRTSFLFLHEDTGMFVAIDGEATADPLVYQITFSLDQPGAWNVRAMIHNYVDTPLLTKFPEMTAVAETALTT